jgi:hypothetical protein
LFTVSFADGETHVKVGCSNKEGLIGLISSIGLIGFDKDQFDSKTNRFIPPLAIRL